MTGKEIAMLVAAAFEAGIIILFVVLGVSQLNGQGASLIAGFNTKSEEEQEKFDKIALCKFMGKMMFAFAFCMVITVIGTLLISKFLIYISVALMLCIVVFMLIYLNTNNRFKKVG